MEDITPQYIRELRLEHFEETQETFGATLGVTPNYISLIENGKKPITFSFLKRIAERYNVRFDITI